MRIFYVTILGVALLSALLYPVMSLVSQSPDYVKWNFAAWLVCLAGFVAAFVFVLQDIWRWQRWLCGAVIAATSIFFLWWALGAIAWRYGL